VPSDLTAANLEHLASQQHLAGVLKLAHKLNAASVLAAVDKCMAGRVGKMEDALQWLALADTCQLSATWAEAIRSACWALCYLQLAGLMLWLAEAPSLAVALQEWYAWQYGCWHQRLSTTDIQSPH